MKDIKADFFKLNPPLRSLYYYGRRLKITNSVHNSKHKLTFYCVLSVGSIQVDIQCNLKTWRNLNSYNISQLITGKVQDFYPCLLALWPVYTR